MTRALGTLALVIIAVWLVAHLLYIGPVQHAAEITLLWALGILAASLGIASIVLLFVGMSVGVNRPVWLRFVRAVRTVSAGLGGALVIVGLLHYRDTEPRGEMHWIILGLVVLLGAAVVHWWVVWTSHKLT